MNMENLIVAQETFQVFRGHLNSRLLTVLFTHSREVSGVAAAWGAIPSHPVEELLNSCKQTLTFIDVRPSDDPRHTGMFHRISFWGPGWFRWIHFKLGHFFRDLSEGLNSSESSSISIYRHRWQADVAHTRTEVLNTVHSLKVFIQSRNGPH